MDIDLDKGKISSEARDEKKEIKRKIQKRRAKRKTYTNKSIYF